jgi:vacuolar-type H+-ATPase subunit E/Vma4
VQWRSGQGRLGRLRVTHRDAQDFYLTAADREEERDENLLTAARVFAALARSESGERAISSAIAEVFPWVRHLTAAERDSFAGELIAALSDAAELAIDRTAHEVIAGWRATARIKADEGLYRQALAPTRGDFGPVQAIG